MTIRMIIEHRETAYCARIGAEFKGSLTDSPELFPATAKNDCRERDPAWFE